MATHSKTRTAVQRLRRAARRLRAREMQRARQAAGPCAPVDAARRALHRARDRCAIHSGRVGVCRRRALPAQRALAHRLGATGRLDHDDAVAHDELRQRDVPRRGSGSDAPRHRRSGLDAARIRSPLRRERGAGDGREVRASPPHSDHRRVGCLACHGGCVADRRCAAREAERGGRSLSHRRACRSTRRGRATVARVAQRDERGLSGRRGKTGGAAVGFPWRLVDGALSQGDSSGGTTCSTLGGGGHSPRCTTR